MRQLPSTGKTEHHQLYDRPPDHSRVRRLRLISELGFSFLSNKHNNNISHTPLSVKITHAGAYPLEDLLPSDILQSGIEVLDLLHDILDLALVRTLDGAGLADREVEVQLDASDRMASAQPTACRRSGRGGEADFVVTRVRGAEREATSAGTPLRNDAVVVVECLVDGYGDADVGVGREGVGGSVVLLRFVVTYCKGISTVWMRLCSRVRGETDQLQGCLWGVPHKSTLALCRRCRSKGSAPGERKL